MAARANWKGYLRLSLVSCPIALFPATSESEKVRFNQLNKNTGNRIRYVKVDAETGDEVDGEDIIKGYQVSKGHYIEITDEGLEAVSVESTRTIDIDQFVLREEIDDLYNIRPYFIAPEGKVGADAFVTIREAIAATGKVALGRLVLTTREHVIALEPRGKGLMGTLLRYPYEVRGEGKIFRGHSEHQGREGDARSCKAHRADQVRPLRTGQVRGPLRDGRSRGDRQEGQGREDRGEEARAAVERDQPHGRVEAKPSGRARREGSRERPCRWQGVQSL